MTTAPTVHEQFAKVMGDVTAVAKEGRNTHQNYNFRGIDGVMNAVGPALREHGCAIIPTTLTANYRDVIVGQNKTPQREATVHVQYTVYGPAGDSFTGATFGEALDSGDKATAKAHSVAYRTFLLQALTIPTHEPDPDESSPVRAAVVTHSVASLKKLLVAELDGDKDDASACWEAADPKPTTPDEVAEVAEAWRGRPM